MGRKSKYSKALQDKLCEFVSNGITVQSMCDAVGIDKATYYRWIESNATFATAIKKAESQRDTNIKSIAIHTILQAMLDGTWQAAAWWLERKFASEFKNVQETVQRHDVNEARKQLEKLLEKNEPRRANSS